ncbi:hypothetical protein C8A05DRAFT_30548 [Staphylotrichum tortipilum]|uniref:Uncharacterized protein n=1 Tax=Staphylotrichum tortipilum TaxID=2831512 RepID=A0AAN6MRB7_9PEZI|nr:hypothetical protein C8A05DRAFT_30548 [Staphylotrichum longicolle]
MSVLGPGTFNVAWRGFPTGLRVLYRRRCLLEMLERDSPVLAVCEVCELLHSSLPLPTPPLPGDKSNLWCENPDDRLHLSGNVTITRAFVRKVTLLRRAGHDVSTFLAALARTTPTRPRRGAYRFVMDDQARAVGESFLLRRQLFITRATPFRGGIPSVQDLVSLRGPQLDLDRSQLENLTMPATCKARRKHTDPSAHLAECYPNDVTPPGGALAPTRECLLSHPVKCCCPVESAFKGHVGGHLRCFTDHCISVLPAPQCGWGRVLVFTAWRDLGDGITRYDCSVNDAKWRIKPRPDKKYDPDDDAREFLGSQVGEVYKKYEDVEEGTAAYTLELRRHVAEMLFGVSLKD